jgi:hypothetical protein
MGTAVPIGMPALRNVTVPSGEPVGAGVIVAVKVTIWPIDAGFGETVRLIAVAVPTVKLSGAEVEAPSTPLPEYTAVRLKTPVGRVVMLRVAVPVVAPT